jgi:Ca2+/Na+ antiporter
MAVVATVTLTFILMGQINTLAPVVTMPFLLTYAAIDYSYFALAQTFDIQLRREERFRAQDFQSPTFETSPHGGYGAMQYRQSEAVDKFGTDLDKLFPERTHHKKHTVSVFIGAVYVLLLQKWNFVLCFSECTLMLFEGSKECISVILQCLVMNSIIFLC